MNDMLNLPMRWDVLGRPVKPVAFGLAILCGTLAVFNASGGDSLGDTLWSALVVPVAATAALLFLFAWWTQRQKAVEWAMLLTFGLHIARGAFIAIVEGSNTLQDLNFWQNGAVVVIAGGAYILERAQPYAALARRRRKIGGARG